MFLNLLIAFNWLVFTARPELAERFDIPLDEYLHRSERQIAEWDALPTQLEEHTSSLAVERSAECGAVEVPCVASAAGIEPEPVGALPLDEIAQLVDEVLGANGDWISPLADGSVAVETSSPGS
jgi:alpha-galactosidase/6-phospho-beta-glucosidase family protein